MVYTEIFKLKAMLENAKVEFEFIDRSVDVKLVSLISSYQISVPNIGESQIISVNQGNGTYGGDEDLLEIFGLLTPEETKQGDVCGYLTAQNVFERIMAHYGRTTE